VVPPGGVPEPAVDALAGQLAGARAVVNAAGLPDGNAPASPRLYGANALLPVLVARACARAGAGRFVHLSSAAVQGGRPLDPVPLDETARVAPFSPYSHAKALGERLLLAEPAGLDGPDGPAGRPVLFRCTWVHAPGKPQTRSLVRLARSPLSCVAGDGTAPTPQVLVGDVAAAVAQLVAAAGPVPPIVLQPHNGMTTGLLLRLLGGREPRHLPAGPARGLVRGMRGYGRLSRRAQAHARRIDMLLFGRRQVPGWLAGQRMAPAVREPEWQRLGPVGPVAGRV
jgi:nucleoside-diphosphate-sugar epimerase